MKKLQESSEVGLNAYLQKIQIHSHNQIMS